MKIALLGTGGVAQAFAIRLIGLGHSVVMGTRNVTEKKANEKFSEFLINNPKLELMTFYDASTFGEMIINVSKGANTMEVVENAGEHNLHNKILIDISNPLDFSNGMPPSLIPEYSNTNSLGEAIQKRFPNTQVVKTLNTMWNGLMLNPAMIGNGDHINYICGNNADAKTKVTHLLNEFGWKNESILDLGDITGARATEGLMPIWLRVYGVKKTGVFNFRIIQ
jgi:predicted dinucleotide-binding enzyme